MPNRLVFRAALCAGFVALATLLAVAQSQPAGQSQMYTMTLVTVNQGMGADYVAHQKSDVIPALQKGGVRSRSAYSSGVFGEPGTFAFFTPIENFSQFDGPNPVVKALGEKGAAELGAKGARLTATRRVMFVRTRPDLSYNVNPNASAPLLLVSEVEVTGGRRGDFEGLIKKEVLPIMQQAKVASYSVTEVIYGGTVGTYYTAIGYANYEAMGKGHPFQVILGDAGTQKLESKFTGVITKLQRFVVRYREDLSFKASGTTE